jgi:hypothetical protein
MRKLCPVRFAVAAASMPLPQPFDWTITFVLLYVKNEFLGAVLMRGAAPDACTSCKESWRKYDGEFEADFCFFGPAGIQVLVSEGKRASFMA